MIRQYENEFVTVDLNKLRQLCWAGFIAMLMCVSALSLCVSVCVSVNKISQKRFNQSTSFLVGVFPLIQR